MEKKNQHEVTFDITVNHHDEEYKIHTKICVVVQVLCFLEKEKWEKKKTLMLVGNGTKLSYLSI